ncbi:hypothetical protein Glove_476g41 [Diversispora epigaea]|uniref:Uncharacterized protein n=1 Tax=Diversispora epigaea TaxID=1348612 RepID=A0A397GKP8_9GLOM|nr:hypothetical protein Glove_476g41 [Diversispora epigaea]
MGICRIESGIIDIETYLTSFSSWSLQVEPNIHAFTVYKVQELTLPNMFKKGKKKNVFSVDEPMIKEYKR